MKFRSMHGGREWALTPEGIYSRGPDGLVHHHRTQGDPQTMRFYLAGWGHLMRQVAREEAVPLSLMLMIVATENGPARFDGTQLEYIPVRREPGYASDDATPHRISVGPCHVLISTARAVMGEPTISRAWLLEPLNNIRAAARFVRQQAIQTQLDPILVAASYNAGGLYRAVPGESRFGNRWHLRAYGNHLDRAAAWYGDACAVLYEAREIWSMSMGGLGHVDLSRMEAA